MTQNLDSLLADTFRLANWPETGGKPVCPWCFDGDELRPGYKPLRRNPFLRTYWCRCCDRAFSDLYGTPIENTSAPLRAWALVVFDVPMTKEQSQYRLNRYSMRKRIKASPFIARWKAEMVKAGITPERLFKVGNGD